jgi:hypothetical protein
VEEEDGSVQQWRRELNKNKQKDEGEMGDDTVANEEY